MLTVDQIVTQIVNQLRLLDPTVSAETGTPELKIIEAVAELIAGQQVDFTVLNQQNNLSSMSAGRLDAYLSIFNFGRQQATPSYGTVTFKTNTAATSPISIPIGTQVIANIGDPTFPSLTFVTTQASAIGVGATSVDVPAQCTVAGSIGDIDANTIVGFASLGTIQGISTVTNAAAFSGGTDLEDDASYKTRFQNTFLRNISGTDDQYLALAVAANSVTKANVVGPISRYQEYVQVPASDDTDQVTPYDSAGTTWPHKRTTAESDIPYSKYTYGTNYYITNGTLDPASAIFYKPGVDFVFNAPPWNGTTGTTDGANPYKPNITLLNYTGSGLASGDVLLMEHAYISQNSRNSYSFGVLNCVDVFVNGQNLQSANSVEVVPTTSNDLQNTNANIWTYQHPTSTVVINFRRAVDGQACAVGSLMQPLYWQPVVDLPDSIQVGTAVYYKANYWHPGDSTYYNDAAFTIKAHYCVAYEVNSYYGTVRARSGIEWFKSGTNYLNGVLPADTLTNSATWSGPKIDAQAGTQFTVESYLYDQNISDLQATMEANKQTTTDVLVHKAKVRYFQPIVTVMYSFGATKSVVDASITAALSSYFDNQYYGAAIQLSDILQVIHNVPGVDNVRWSNPDTSGNKVQEVSANGYPISTGVVWYTTDFFIQDNELAASPAATAVTVPNGTDASITNGTTAASVFISVRAQNTWGS